MKINYQGRIITTFEPRDPNKNVDQLLQSFMRNMPEPSSKGSGKHRGSKSLITVESDFRGFA
jgi:hypothetical protein